MSENHIPQLASVNMNAAYAPGHDMTNGQMIAHCFDLLVNNCHAASHNRGWWHDPITGESLIPGEINAYTGVISDDYDVNLEDLKKAFFPYVIGTKIALIHSEISEALEAYRTDAVDDKIPMPGITAELIDAVIRIGDLLGCLQNYASEYPELIPPQFIDLPVENYRELFDLGKAFMLKTPVNAVRADHDLKNRAKPKGKKF